MELAALFGSLPAPGSALCRADPGVGMRGRSRTRSRDYLLRSPCAPGSSPCLRSQPGSSTMPESKSSVVARGLMDSLRQSWGGSITEEEVLTDPIVRQHPHCTIFSLHCLLLMHLVLTDDLMPAAAIHPPCC